jgi:PAS domain S-box-containing protein
MRVPPAVLIVEDDATTAALIDIQLKTLGYQVMGVVTRGEDAIEQVAMRQPDLMLLDVTLEGAMDGVDVATAVLRSGNTVPVVFLTSKNDHATMERIRSSLPFGCLVKPPQQEELGTALTIALRGHELERQARAGHENLAAILDGVADAVIALDSSGVVTFMNRSAEQLGGWSRYEGEGRTLDTLLPLIDDPLLVGPSPWAGVLAASAQREQILHLRARDGALRIVRFSLSPIRSPDALGANTVVLLSDLTNQRREEIDRLHLQQEVRRMARALKVLSESSRALQHAVSEVELFTEVCRITVDLGYRLAWVGMAAHDARHSVLPVAHAGYRDRYLDEMLLTWDDDGSDHGPTGAAIRSGEVAIARDILADERYSDWRMEAAKRGYASGIALPLKSGDRVLGALTIYAIEGDAFGTDEVELLHELARHLSYGLVVLRGRAERQRAERDLLKAEARYRVLVEQVPVVTYIAALDETSSTLYMSPQIAAMTGFPPERWISTTAFFVTRLHPGDRMRVLAELALCREQGQPLACEYRLLAADGRTVWIRDEAKVVRDEQGRPEFIHGVLMDITQRKLAEESLHHAHQTLSALIAASPLAIFALDRTGCVANVWNPAAARLFGWSEAEVMGRPLPIVSPEKQQEFRSFFSRVLTGEVFTGVEVQRHHRDGTPIDLSMAAAPLSDPDGSPAGLIAMLSDITQRKRAEAALAAAQRDATVGRMAAVVAHEVNNPLAAMKAWLGLLRSDLAAQPEARKALDLISEQVDRIARTVRNLLGFARQREARERQVPCGELIRTVAELFAGRMRAKSITFELRVAEALPLVQGDPDQLQEVLINLLENACQALGHGRRVMLSANVREHLIEIVIEDDGPGLGTDPERLFTPFYTTKVNGTGLGLTVARRICVAHGGRLLAENAVSGGARFRVVLPALLQAEEVP